MAICKGGVYEAANEAAFEAEADIPDGSKPGGAVRKASSGGAKARSKSPKPAFVAAWLATEPGPCEI
jgi:hypothetical protein